jgi:hypothetical protein
MNMEKNVKSARAHRLLSWWYQLVTAIAFLVMLFSSRVQIVDKVIGLSFVLLFFGGLYFLHRLVAAGAMDRKEWARKTSIGMGIVMFLGFPIGTLIGIYLLVNSSWETTVVPSNIDRVQQIT